MSRNARLEVQTYTAVRWLLEKLVHKLVVQVNRDLQVHVIDRVTSSCAVPREPNVRVLIIAVGNELSQMRMSMSMSMSMRPYHQAVVDVAVIGLRFSRSGYKHFRF